MNLRILLCEILLLYMDSTCSKVFRTEDQHLVLLVGVRRLFLLVLVVEVLLLTLVNDDRLEARGVAPSFPAKDQQNDDPCSTVSTGSRVWCFFT